MIPFLQKETLQTKWLVWLDYLLALAIELQQEGYEMPGVVRIAMPVQQSEIDLLARAAYLREEQDRLLALTAQRIDKNDIDSLVILFAAFSASPLEQLAIIMALGYAENQKYGRCYGTLLGKDDAQLPNVLLVRSLYELYSTPAPDTTLRNAFSPLRRMVFELNDWETLRLRGRVIQWLHGERMFVGGNLAKVCSICSAPTEELLVNQTQFDELQRSTAQSETLLVQLCGKEGSGRKFLLAHRSAQSGVPMFQLDLAALLVLAPIEQDVVLDQLALEVRLSLGEVHIIHCPQEAQEDIKRICIRLQSISPILFLSTEEPALLPIPMLMLSLSMQSIADCQQVWCAWAKRVPFSPEIDLMACGVHYRLTPGRIGQVCQDALAMAHAAGRAEITRADFLPVVHRGSASELEKLATRVPAAYQWDDLILPEEQKSMLHLASERLRLRQTVDETWGFGAKIAYGRGLSMLFCGAPGTGKTMAAQVLAQEAGRELFAVDLSQLNSKYIGELEKNIARVFNAARDSNAILFFDEADSLFAKRTEVQSSNDRHANAGVAFLLQQMERYEGMCILATNLFQNFDAAFVRRITFVVRFQKPTADERFALWQSVFPKDAPLDEHLALRAFAQHLEISGSSIKAMAYNAAFLAAKENTSIQTEHLIQALRLECQKTGAIMPEENLFYF